MTAAGDSPARGILAFAESYRLAGALILAQGGAADMEMHAPTRFLFKHCIELCFKAYLTKKGMTDKELRRHGHDSVALAKAAIAQGIVMDQYDLTIILDLLAREDPIDDRYLRHGARMELKPEVLGEIAERLTHATQDNIAAVEMMEAATGE